VALSRPGPGGVRAAGPAGEPNDRSKLGRAPTLVVASAKLTGDEHRTNDVLATAVAVYIVLLAAHARGLASYWRTPRLLQSPEGRAAVGLEDDEEFVALIHLGEPVTHPVAKPRKPLADSCGFWTRAVAAAPDMAGTTHRRLDPPPVLRIRRV
jgi:nitroreductase